LTRLVYYLEQVKDLIDTQQILDSGVKVEIGKHYWYDIRRLVDIQKHFSQKEIIQLCKNSYSIYQFSDTNRTYYLVINDIKYKAFIWFEDEEDAITFALMV
jgi:hypothetical protein